MVVKLSQNVVGRFDRLTCVSPPFSAFGVSKMNFDSPLSDFSRSRLLRLDDDMMTSEQQPQEGELSLCRLERGREKTEGGCHGQEPETWPECPLIHFFPRLLPSEY